MPEYSGLYNHLKKNVRDNNDCNEYNYNDDDNHYNNHNDYFG